ncbi:MAG TPA: hypothetical protein VHE35_35460 [Kofleriaceae bacterium]|nr:hypothetical protein [Kofleriaceae bacterium]
MGKLLALTMGGLMALLAGCAGAARNVRPPTPRPPLLAGEAPPIRRVEPGVLHGLMTDGALRVVPDAALTAALAAYGDRPLATVVSVCLDAGGRATGVVRTPSELPAFDEAALRVVERWRFRPYLDGGAPAPACSVARFVHGETEDDALPRSLIELPAPRLVRRPADAGSVRQRATPGVAVSRVCRVRGSRAAPEVAWLQSSGDDETDRGLFERRATAPADEPADHQRVCALWTAIAGLAPATSAPVVIAPDKVPATWLSGDKNVFPADDVKDEIQRSSTHELHIAVMVCVDETGRPAQVSLLAPSGFTGYDLDIVNAVAAWRYQPYMVDGRVVPVCGLVDFGYRQS